MSGDAGASGNRGVSARSAGSVGDGLGGAGQAGAGGSDDLAGDFGAVGPSDQAFPQHFPGQFPASPCRRTPPRAGDPERAC